MERGEPQYVAIEGQAGIGKTTLINYLLDITPKWRHVLVELDPTDEELPGAALRRLFTALTGSRSVQLELSVEELVQRLLDVILDTYGETILVIEDIQWIDPLSAEVFWRCAREISVGRSLVVVSSRPTANLLTERIDRFLASGRRGEHLSLERLTLEGVRDAIRQRLRIPVSARIPRIILDATQGIPVLVQTVLNWLTSAPHNQRQLTAALEALNSQPEGSWQIVNQALLASLDSLSATQRFAVSLLAVSGSSMPLPLLQQILTSDGHGTVDADSLLRTDLVATKPGSAELAITHPRLAPLIAQQLSGQQRSHLHELLAAHTEGDPAMFHRVQALTLQPDPERVRMLVEELVESATSAMKHRWPDVAFRRFRWALTFTDDARLLAMAIRAAMLADPLKLLPGVRGGLDRASPSRSVSAAAAYLHLADNDLDSALHEINHGLKLPETDSDHAGTLSLGYALAAAGRSAYLSGRWSAVVSPVDEATRQLKRIRVGIVRDDNDDDDAPADPLEIEIIALQALIRIWVGLNRGSVNDVYDFLADMGRQVAALEEVPGAETTVHTITGTIGSVMLRQGNIPRANAMLHSAYESGMLADQMRVSVASQLGRIAFQAGNWDDAQRYFTRSVEDALLLREDTGMLMSYASAALTPLARGEVADGEALLELAESRKGTGQGIVDIAVAHCRAVGALMAWDHERATRFFAEIDGCSTGWAVAGYSFMPMYARELVMTGKYDLIPGLLRRAKVETRSVVPELGETIVTALHAAQAWANGDIPTAYQHLRETLRLLDSMPPARADAAPNLGGGHALFRAIAAVDLAQLVAAHPVMAEHRFEAAELVHQASAMLLRCGATHMHEQTSALISALTGLETPAIQPAPDITNRHVSNETLARRERAFRRLNELTSRERQISLEIAQGRSNREIATALFLSVRTVEYHVANSLAKLSLPTRVELRNALRPAVEMRVMASWSHRIAVVATQQAA